MRSEGFLRKASTEGVLTVLGTGAHRHLGKASRGEGSLSNAAPLRFRIPQALSLPLGFLWLDSYYFRDNPQQGPGGLPHFWMCYPCCSKSLLWGEHFRFQPFPIPEMCFQVLPRYLILVQPKKDNCGLFPRHTRGQKRQEN